MSQKSFLYCYIILGFYELIQKSHDATRQDPTVYTMENVLEDQVLDCETRTSVRWCDIA